jgi:hypothetical protein
MKPIHARQLWIQRSSPIAKSGGSGLARPNARLKRRKAAGLLLLVVLLLTGGAVAWSDGGYDLSWWTADGGGATDSTGGGYWLSGTVGQPDAGLLEGGGYVLGGGFWRGGAVAPPGYFIYLPLAMRNH